MINLKNLKSLFVEGNEENEVKQPEGKAEAGSKSNGTPKEPAKKTTVSKKNGNSSPPAANNDTSGKFNKRHYELLINAIEANNLDGFDFLEFKNSVNALSHLPIDEATKFRSAFATASTMGLTLDRLVNSTEHYINVVEAEKDKFKSALKLQVEQRIVAREEETRQLEAAIQAKKEQIERLKSEIAKHEQELSQKREGIEDIRDKIESTERDFMATSDNLLGKFKGDLGKIKKYLAE